MFIVNFLISHRSYIIDLNKESVLSVSVQVRIRGGAVVLLPHPLGFRDKLIKIRCLFSHFTLIFPLAKILYTHLLVPLTT